jgi:hypothetical protein
MNTETFVRQLREMFARIFVENIMISGITLDGVAFQMKGFNWRHIASIQAYNPPYT